MAKTRETYQGSSEYSARTMHEWRRVLSGVSHYKRESILSDLRKQECLVNQFESEHPTMTDNCAVFQNRGYITVE
jgi:hypothetical protein